MKRCVIVGGADIIDYNRIKNFLHSNDFFVYCDSGLKHEKPLGYKANLIVGDFDSYSKPERNVEIIHLPCEKDDTDTVYAVKEAIKRGYEDFLIIGAVGKRFDHTLGNISILLMLHNLNKNAVIIDEYSQMEIVADKVKFIDDSFPYFSLLAIDGAAEGVYIKNAKYPLINAKITPEYQYGVSNEVIKGKEAEIEVRNGKLLLIKIEKE